MTSEDTATVNLDSSDTGGFQAYRYDNGFIIGIFSTIVFLIVISAGASYFCYCSRSHRDRGPRVSHGTTKHEETGLEEGTLNSCPVITYAEAKHLDGRATDDNCCSVCLVDYGEDDELRMLPQCGHLFHVHCVDPWLWLLPNCPLCRSAICVSVESPC